MEKSRKLDTCSFVVGAKTNTINISFLFSVSYVKGKENQIEQQLWRGKRVDWMRASVASTRV